MSKVQDPVRSASSRPAVKTAKAAKAGDLVRMGELSRSSGVPSSTIKHYLREGLLPGKSVSTARNSALYDRALVDQIRHIKDLQTTHFLPLWRIKEVLAGTADVATATVVAAVDRVVESGAPRSAPLREVLARGLTRAEHGFLVERGLINAGERIVGDDLALCEALVRARQAGLTERLPVIDMIARYQTQIEHLVAAEIELFRNGIVEGAGASLAASTVEAMKMSERLVVLLRRRLLLPHFERVSRTPGHVKTTPTKKSPTKKGPTKKGPTKKGPTTKSPTTKRPPQTTKTRR